MSEILIRINNSQSSKIFFGNNLYCKPEFLDNVINNRKTIIISDENLHKLYPDFFEKFSDIIILPPGEQEKSFTTIEFLLNEFVKLKIDKKSLIIGFGGGVISDIVGFAASIYMRGTSFGFIASTLLSQVDAAIGGKNGVNLNKNKNFAGLINQPEFVLTDVKLLKSLSTEEFKSGLAEVIKYAIIGDAKLFDLLAKNKKNILENRDLNILDSVVQTCTEIKSRIISEDPYDSGLRHILNFGHTFGHAYEVRDRLLHGIAIAKGIKTASSLSLKTNLINQDIYNKIIDLLELYEYDLTTNITSKHLEIIESDKKKNNDSISFVFIKDIGAPKIKSISFKDLFSLLD